jgi:lipopolysaccharide transport system ATP-binding protein
MAIIRVENISKKYIIGHQQQGGYLTFRDTLAQSARSFLRRLSHPFLASSGQPLPGADLTEEFWALKDVSFNIEQGERVGIIGRNGAGKSTLLKILSRITEPTAGRVTIDGRVASLLEVGTGFHPELSGRENIFLNGAILGMGKEEIKRKFDEIVAFAEVEKFLDTPVKHYSSGMYVRLAFAVAAHLEPEILIVDEVLAVGDAQFQKKCLGKMEEVGKEGRTVLFVSHNMQAISQLCNRAILLCSGKMACDDSSDRVIGEYLKGGISVDNLQNLQELIKQLPSDPVFKLESIKLTQEGKLVGEVIENGKPLEVEVSYHVFERTTGLRVYFDLCDDQDLLLFRTFHDEASNGMPVVEAGNYVSKAVIPANLLGPVCYELRIRAGIFNVRSCTPETGIRIPLQIEMTSCYNKAYLSDTFRGKLALAIDWETKRIS